MIVLCSVYRHNSTLFQRKWSSNCLYSVTAHCHFELLTSKVSQRSWNYIYMVLWLKLLCSFPIQPSCRALQRHSRTHKQPHPHWHPVQHQGQRQWPLHLQVRPARIRRYAAPPTPSFCCSPTPISICLFITNLVKHFCPPPCKCPEGHFIFPCANIKLLLTYRGTFRCCISWARTQLIQTFSLNSQTRFFLQVGGLRLAVLPTWTAYITPARPVWFATMALSGTIGRVQIWWLQWQTWWCALQTSDGMMSDWVMSPSMNIMNNMRKIV